VLRRILAALTLMSLAGNGVLYGMWQRSKAETKTLVSELAVQANDRLAESLSHQAQSHQDREAELLRRLERSDEVARDALARAASRDEELRRFRERTSAQRAEDPTYDAWADVILPPGVAERLEALQ